MSDPSINSVGGSSSPLPTTLRPATVVESPTPANPIAATVSATQPLAAQRVPVDFAIQAPVAQSPSARLDLFPKEPFDYQRFDSILDPEVQKLVVNAKKIQDLIESKHSEGLDTSKFEKALVKAQEKLEQIFADHQEKLRLELLQMEQEKIAKKQAEIAAQQDEVAVQQAAIAEDQATVGAKKTETLAAIDPDETKIKKFLDDYKNGSATLESFREASLAMLRLKEAGKRAGGSEELNKFFDRANDFINEMKTQLSSVIEEAEKDPSKFDPVKLAELKKKLEAMKKADLQTMTAEQINNLVDDKAYGTVLDGLIKKKPPEEIRRNLVAAVFPEKEERALVFDIIEEYKPELYQNFFGVKDRFDLETRAQEFYAHREQIAQEREHAQALNANNEKATQQQQAQQNAANASNQNTLSPSQQAEKKVKELLDALGVPESIARLIVNNGNRLPGLADLRLIGLTEHQIQNFAKQFSSIETALKHEKKLSTNIIS